MSNLTAGMLKFGRFNCISNTRKDDINESNAVSDIMLTSDVRIWPSAAQPLRSTAEIDRLDNRSPYVITVALTVQYVHSEKRGVKLLAITSSTLNRF